MLRLSLLFLLAPHTLGDHANHATHTLGSQALHATYTPGDQAHHATYTPGDQAHHTSQAVEPYSPVLAQEAAYPDYGQEYAQTSAYGAVTYDPASAAAYGNYYDYPTEQDNEVDTASDKQSFAAFIPFLASFSLPLGAALITFSLLVTVAAAFLLFPKTVEVQVRRRREVREHFSMGGLCSDSSSTVCFLLQKILSSQDCLEAASCEVAALSRSQSFPTLSSLLTPFTSSRYYDRYTGVDCGAIKCSLRQ